MISRVTGLLLLAFLLPGLAYGQASIAGAVKDASGAVLPGVTVEATSPALIEKVRAVTTDGTGQYRIVNLRPGTYSVQFTLTGFSPVRRDGIELTGSFTATVDTELKVGAVAETITVTAESPIVDVQGTAQQRVMSKAVIDAIPVGRGQADLAVLVPGMTAGSQDVGGQNTVQLSAVAIHDGRTTDQRQMVDGMTIRNLGGPGQTTNFIPDVGSSQEVTIDYSTGSAEAATGGVLYNFVPRVGGNRYQGSFFGTATSSSFQNSNITPELQSLGLASPNHLKDLHDFNGSFGGPIKRDQLWFFSSARFQSNRTYIAGLWNNLNAGNPNAWSYGPDLGQQAFTAVTDNSANTRLTWQASPKNKFNVYYENHWRNWPFASAGISPEAGNNWAFPRLRTATATWSSTLSNRLLLDVRGAMHAEDIQDYWPTDPSDPFQTLIGVTEQGGLIPGLRYRGKANFSDSTIFANDHQMTNTYEMRASLSYVSGAHDLKVGVSDLWGAQIYASNDIPAEVGYRFLNGVPNQITERQLVYQDVNGRLTEFSAFAQDKWTVKRFTFSEGIRFDYAWTGWDAFNLGPVALVPNRNINYPATPWYGFKDISPRLGAAYDMFGNQKTALKVSLGRYPQAVDPSQGNPIAFQLVPRVTRSWTDRTAPGSPNYYVPNCNLINPQANGDCGTISDLRFGTAIPSTVYDPAILQGWNARQYNWEFSARVQHELSPRVGVDVGYFRRIYGNFTVTENLAVSPSDFTTFSIPAPVDSRLPNGGGYVVSGLYNLNPNKVGQVNNYVTSANSFGGQIEHFDGVDLTLNARMPGGGLVRGGLSTGRITQDDCAIVTANPQVTVTTTVGAVQSTAMCHVQTPFLPQVKLLATYPIPKVNADVAATFQSLPGPLIAANFIASNALVQPSLGRPLSGGAANTTVNLVAPGTMYGERLNQLDLRLSKAFRLDQLKLHLNFDLYNLMNGNAILRVNNNYGSWLTPTAILDPRLYKISVQADF